MDAENGGVRRSQRLLRNPPEVFATPLLGPRTVERVGDKQETTTKTHTLISFSESASVVSVKSGRRSNQSVCTNQSEVARLKLKAEIESLQRLGHAETEFLLAKQKFDMERKVEEKRLEMEKLGIEEDLNDDDASYFQQEEPGHEAVVNDADANVRRWLSEREPERERRPEVANSSNEVMVQVAQTNSRLDKLLSRHAVSKELPHFNGNPEEWPMFFHQYHRTTEMCGLSPDENVTRLEKCLKGKAREAVLPILGLPQNVDRVMKTLENLFGRSDQIIKSMIQKVKTCVSPATKKAESLIHFSNLVANLVATMKTLDRLGHMYNPQLFEDLVLKLSYQQQFDWCGHAKSLPQEPSLENFQVWLEEVALTASMMPFSQPSTTDDRPDSKKNNKKIVMSTVTKNEKGCYHCSKEGHGIVDCKDFIDAACQSRWKTVKSQNLCFCCLSKGHKGTDCKKKEVCAINGCDRQHHKLLHKQATSEVKENFCGHVDVKKALKEVLLRVLPVNLFGPKGSVFTYALIDEGSTVTMVDSEVATTLGLNGPEDGLCIQWTHDITKEDPKSKRVSLEIAGVSDGAKKFRLENAMTVSKMSLTTQTVDMEVIKKLWPYLSDIPFSSMKNVQPMVLIGSDNILLTTPRRLRQGHWNDPVATKTWLGWVVHGNLPVLTRVDRNFVHMCNIQVEESELMKIIKESFSTENFGVRIVHPKSRSKEDEKALQILESTTRRVGTKFQTGLLWKSMDIMLPESRTTAMRRLHCMERKMDRDPKFADQYCSKVEDYLKKGYCRKLTPEEVRIKRPRTYYLPHFATYNPQKPEKLRLVFDAACKSFGVSLNDCLLKGPDLLNPLPAVLWRFRRYKIGIAGDIREMFHQVQIIPEDQDSQRFLWRGKERTKDPEEFVMQVMIFGAACSPSSAIYVTQLNADELQNEFPDDVVDVKRNTYVDDFTYGADDENMALEKLQNCVEVFNRGGFTMCNWACSSKEVIAKVPGELRAKNWVDLSADDELPTERVLGLRWDPEKDEFLFQLKYPKVNAEVLNLKKVPTKAEVSSLVMSPYDPCGFLSHFIIKGRMLIQEMWLKKLEWKQEISGEILVKWRQWVTELKQITEVRVPRCYAPGVGLREAKLTLHVFCDASEKAFATVVYLRINRTGEVSLAFVAARARVAPLKALSIPRLELQAAVMASRLAKSIQEEIDLPICSTTYWTDSRTVLCWLRDDSRKYLQFIAHRVGEILESTEPSQWRWVPTLENPADEATRNNDETQFHPNSRWYQGPEFLKLPEEQWPSEKRVAAEALPVETLEIRKEYVNLVSTRTEKLSIMDATRFSSWLKRVRTTAYMLRFVRVITEKQLRFVRVITEKQGRTERKLTGEELLQAQIFWWKNVQKTHFGNDVATLAKKQVLENDSRLKNLTPMLDSEGVIRMQGRTERAEELHFGTKFPVILHPEHPYTKLLISHLHKESRHQGVETVISNLRLDYWVLQARAAVKRGFSECMLCKVRRARPSPPIQGVLPTERVTRQQRPFANTGIDYFGPLIVTANRKNLKRYGVIFTCLSVRAIHLEIAPDLSTDSAINAIRRFIARRGSPDTILSDNGTNFHGADRELRKAIQEIDTERIAERFAGNGLTWKFNPPSSPHMGGIWERLVRSVKTAFYSTLRDKTLREDVLHTILCEVEFIVNNRPLTYVSVDPTDPECLTPNHFLMCGKVVGNVPGTFSDDDLCRRSQWKIVQRYTDIIWTRWVKEYVPTLTKRTKWFLPVAPIKVGDVVVVVDKDGPRNSWPLGRIVNIYPGKDGQVRVVDVKTKDGVYRRPASKIGVLDICNVDEEPGPS